MASSLRADLDGDGNTDARTTQKTTQVLAAPTAEKSPAPIKHQQGNDPCSVVGQPAATCTNVTGSTFTATPLLGQRHGEHRLPERVPVHDRLGEHPDQLEALHADWSPSPGPPEGRRASHIVDDNVRGHPIAYTPTVACSTIQSGGGNGP